MIENAFAATLIVMTGLGAWCWYAFLLNRDDLFASSHDGNKPFGFVDFAILSLAWLMAPAAIVSLGFLQFSVESAEDLSPFQTGVLTLCASGTQLLVCLLATQIFRIRYGSLATVLGVCRSTFVAHALTGARWFVMVVPVLLGLQALLSLLIPYEHPTLEALKDNFAGLTILATWFGATFAAPICEEFVFRGVFQGWLQRLNRRTAPENSMLDITGGWPVQTAVETTTKQNQLSTQLDFWWPILVSSAVFGAVHFGQGAAPYVLFFFGLAVGFLYRKTGSLIPCIALHFMLNAFTMFWSTIKLVFQ